jgi:hypothetical protein
VANSTDEPWSYAGFSLQTYAFNIQTIGGDRNGVPGLKGSNLSVPLRDGDIFMPKSVESRVISLGMWVQGSNFAGSAPSQRSSEEEFDRNWAFLRKLFWGSPGKQFPLSKTVAYWKADGTRVPIKVTAMASFAGGLSPTMTGRNRGRFTVDLLLADPWFYADEPITKTLSNTGSQAWTIPAAEMGDAPTNRISVLFSGTAARPGLQLDRNAEYPYPVSFRLESKLDSSTLDTNVEVNVQEWSVFDIGANRSAVTTVTHSGAKSWFEIGTLDNQTITVKKDSGTLFTTIRVWPRYF